MLEPWFLHTKYHAYKAHSRQQSRGGIKLGIAFCDQKRLQEHLTSFTTHSLSQSLAPPALLFLPRLMRILLSISILAFVALLWATVSIAHHISSDRRRRRSLRTRQASEPLALISSAVAELRITEVFSPAPILSTDLQRPAPASQPARQPATPAFPAFSLPKLTPALSVSDPQLPSAALLSGLLAQPHALHPALAESRPASPASMSPLLRRPVQSAPRPAETAANHPSRRTDWAYFNKDMGDLSDPVPSRIRDRSLNRAMPRAQAR